MSNTVHHGILEIKDVNEQLHPATEITNFVVCMDFQPKNDFFILRL